ncbi:type I-E CRISPR-associated protein Cse1/CasA [Allokutzneria albata]|uniref:CRISPR-associated protein, Cse1 family n=1 Tax=Allokutzneria albata TaxID=211114 RepID=A0A1G9WE07_ALLAB|nr:type I-E CRISPR-associated protein Cse1/CasA [Allokutzneria albata]SDM82794.1 CRISPR-associated protein, Cse1 family [Allokutzneria albata]
MTAADPPTYNLIDQPWLLARTRDGETAELSLTQVLRRASQLSGLVGDVPTQAFALTRLLLAVTHAAVRGPRDIDHWLDLWHAAELPVDDITSYVDKHRDRFDLLHPTTPFFQVADLRTAKGEMTGLDRLVADVPNGHPFFTTRLGADLTLSFAEAARWLVHAHAFDPSGIKSGAEGDPRVKGGKGYPIGTGWSGFLGGVLPEGHTLKDTLLLNLIPHDYGDPPREAATDLPAWERTPAGPAEEQPGGRAPIGPVDLYTWQSRRIRLAHNGTRVTAVLICNGERITPQNKQSLEPHSGWRRSTAQEKKLGRSPIYMPREHNPERAIWRGLQSLLPGAEKPQGSEAAPFLAPSVLEWISSITHDIGLDYPLRLHTLGMTYGNQSSTTDDIIDDTLSLRAVLIRQDARRLAAAVIACAKAAEDTAGALGRLAGDLAAAAGCGRDERHGPTSRAQERAYADLDAPFRAWIRNLDADTEVTEAQSSWHRQAKHIVTALGEDLIRRAPATAWTGRVIDQKLMTVTHADRAFRGRLRAALPLAQPEPAQ